jgi:hypothetical protein
MTPGTFCIPFVAFAGILKANLILVVNWWVYAWRIAVLAPQVAGSVMDVHRRQA